ncbi:MAG: DUF6265 family protein [Pseudomonadota bacterium]
MIAIFHTMRRIALALPLVTPLLLTDALAHGHDNVDIADFGWISGCWDNGKGDREIWSQPEGDMLFGHAVTLKQGKATFFEQLRIDARGAEITYFASPNGAAPVRFALVERGPKSATFINPDHDFPQRIAYWRDGDDLVAVISLANGSQPRIFRKSRCR